MGKIDGPDGARQSSCRKLPRLKGLCCFMATDTNQNDQIGGSNQGNNAGYRYSNAKRANIARPFCENQ